MFIANQDHLSFIFVKSENIEGKRTASVMNLQLKLVSLHYLLCCLLYRLCTKCIALPSIEIHVVPRTFTGAIAIIICHLKSVFVMGISINLRMS